MLLFVTLLLVFLFSANSFYLPGLSPKNYFKNDIVPLHVNSLVPALKDNGKVKATVAYEYYNKNFNFCRPKDGLIKPVSGSLGSVLSGDRIYESPFELFMLKNEQCKLLCVSDLSIIKTKFLIARIEENYKLDWLIDGLPAAQFYKKDNHNVIIDVGLPLGSYEPNESPTINNHYDIEIHYHTVNKLHYRVVGVYVTPKSKLTKLSSSGSVDCSIDSPMHLTRSSKNKITYTYSVLWKESEITWATRWDTYLTVKNKTAHWLRALRSDVIRYNQNENDAMSEDFGWKLIHGDVFRPPQNLDVLCVLVGNGYQLFYMCLSTILFALLGFLSPSSRGSLTISALLLYMIFGFSSGYNSSHLYNSFGGSNKQSNIVKTIFIVPLDSSSSVPAGALFQLVLLWFVVNIPLSLLGSYFGYRTRIIRPPVDTNQIPRQVPGKVWYLRRPITILLGGLFPFGAISIELYFIMSSWWFRHIYYMFGFLFLVYILLVITCAEMTMLMIYFNLCSEDYNWWWLSFQIGGASGIYMFAYGIYFYIYNTSLTYFSGTLLYFGWLLIASLLLFILTGTIGFVASHYFILNIYKLIKVD
ncbi:hypothetical protein BB561_003649 [Smittium simulii]|uniref:Transmembrane 9 superfamily member n=1 Tax=Smittium simulii TaxID=133385 RepID=A0A2T9YK60_9FUNG|nr:hypothetical protein BB561_003649 [Smittium simulii]